MHLIIENVTGRFCSDQYRPAVFRDRSEPDCITGECTLLDNQPALLSFSLRDIGLLDRSHARYADAVMKFRGSRELTNTNM